MVTYEQATGCHKIWPCRGKPNIETLLHHIINPVRSSQAAQGTLVCKHMPLKWI